MARSQGICGWETGRTDLGYTITGGTLVTAAPRTGVYNYQDKRTVASTFGVCEFNTNVGITDGALFQIKLRVYFQPVTFPSAADLFLLSIPSLAIRIEMDTSGKVRFNSSLAAAPAYSAQTILGHWYQCRFRLQGYNLTAAVANSGRYRAMLDIYDCGLDGLQIPSLLLSYTTPAQGALFAPGNINCDPTAGAFMAPGWALQEMAGKLEAFYLTVSDGTIGGCGASPNGTYGSFPTQTQALGPGCFEPPNCTGTNGVVHENGLLNGGVSLSNFLISGSPVSTTNIRISIGNTTGGASSTREINYDDLYWDFQDGVDVPVAFADQFPLSTAVQPYPVTAQGVYDDFTPGNSPGDVDNIPMDDANTVTAATSGLKTSYLHAALPAGVGNIAEHIRLYVRWGGSASVQNAILNSVGTGLLSADMTNAVAANGALADFPFEGANYLTAEEFNDIEYGLRLAASSTTDLHSIFIEVLTGTQIQLEPADPFSVAAAIALEATVPVLITEDVTMTGRTLGFRLVNQGEEINVPETWRLERLDIGPRNENKA